MEGKNCDGQHFQCISSINLLVDRAFRRSFVYLQIILYENLSLSFFLCRVKKNATDDCNKVNSKSFMHYYSFLLCHSSIAIDRKRLHS